MAGSAIFSYRLHDSGKVVTLQWACTTDAAAASPELTSPTITQPGDTALYKYGQEFSGTIIYAEINPDGSTPPTDNYDVELRDTDDSTIDYLGGLGDNCSQTNTKWGCPVDEVNGVAVNITNRKLLPYGANCGNSKLFTLRIDLALD